MAESALNGSPWQAVESFDDESIDHGALPSLTPPDRLPPMLFLAALVHGILILGVTFNAVLGDEFREAISLEVTIVADPDPNVLEPERAEYLAQASQQGEGNTLDQARPSAEAESPVPVDNPGVDDGTAPEDLHAVEDAAEQVLTANDDSEFSVRDLPREDPADQSIEAAYLEAGLETTLPLPQEAETNLKIHDDNPRELVTSVDTKESKVAGYLNRWKTRIETVGVKYFPDNTVIDGVAGSPTLEVTIDASGQLLEVLVRHSSGSHVLDQIALGILRRAAPFDPFPEAIRLDYDQLRFAYKWQFSHLGIATAARAD